jgi:hypothetical protein
MTQTDERGVLAAHATSAIFLAVAAAGAQPSPQPPVSDRAIQYVSANAAAGMSKIAASARSENTIVRITYALVPDHCGGF